MKNIIITIAAFLLFASAAFAQGTIQGTVLNEKASPIPNLTVTLVDAEGTTDTTITDEDGAFSFEDLDAGKYQLTVTVPAGYQPFSQNNVVVTDEDGTTVQFVLKRKLAPVPPVPQQTPGPVRPTPTVSFNSEPAIFKIEDDGYSGAKLAIVGELWHEDEPGIAKRVYRTRYIRHGVYTGDPAGSNPVASYKGDGSDPTGAWRSGNWRFEATGDGYYYIVSPYFGVALVAGNDADNKIYFQTPNGRDNAKWKLVPMGNNRFYLIDKKHGLAIVAGDNADGQIYHQAPAARRNAMWTITLLSGNEDIPKEYKVK